MENDELEKRFQKVIQDIEGLKEKVYTSSIQTQVGYVKHKLEYLDTAGYTQDEVARDHILDLLGRVEELKSRFIIEPSKEPQYTGEVFFGEEVFIKAYEGKMKQTTTSVNNFFPNDARIISIEGDVCNDGVSHPLDRRVQIRKKGDNLEVVDTYDNFEDWLLRVAVKFTSPSLEKNNSVDRKVEFAKKRGLFDILDVVGGFLMQLVG